MNDDGDDISQDDITEARSLGWAPRERWRGNPQDFIEAPEFLRRAREHLPVVKSLLDKEKAERAREKADYEARQRDFEKRLSAQSKMSQRALDLQKQQLIDKFEDEKRRALDITNPVERQRTYDAVRRRESDTLREVAREEKEAAQPQPQPQAQPQTQKVPEEALEWGKRNPWFYMNPAMRDEAIAIMDAIDKSDPDLPLNDRFDKVTKQISNRYPEWFPRTEQRREHEDEPAPAPTRRVAAVEGGNAPTRNGGAGRAAKGFKELPSEARSECANLISQGYLRVRKGEDPEKGKQRLQSEYAATYWAEYGE